MPCFSEPKNLMSGSNKYLKSEPSISRRPSTNCCPWLPQYFVPLLSSQSPKTLEAVDEQVNVLLPSKLHEVMVILGYNDVHATLPSSPILQVTPGLPAAYPHPILFSPVDWQSSNADRKSTRLNSSHSSIS